MVLKFDIKRYSKNRKIEWNNFISTTKNGTFLFNRNYMDYHSDRYIEHSLMFFKEEKLLAVFPANEKDNSIQSHGGLSYGGLIYSTKLRTKDVIQILDLITIYYKNKGFKELYYKSIPEIYHLYPASEDKYALFKIGANLIRRDVSSTIDLEYKLKLSKGRKALLTKAKKLDIQLNESDDFITFFKNYNIHLNDKYGVSAVHSPKEMKLLKSKFPENIKLIVATDSEGFLGGAILYFTSRVIHAQYIHFSDKGKENGSFDLLLNQLFEDYKTYKYFDFGISTENDGQYLNEGLISFKESFGARATVCDFYKIKL